MAASPRQVSGAQSAIQTGSQATISMNTPTASSSLVPGATTSKQGDKRPSDLFDPTHIPTIFSRIQSISRLLIEASNNAHSLSIPPQQQQNSEKMEVDDQTKVITDNSTNNRHSFVPDFAMGAMDEDDVNSGFEAAFGLSADGNGGEEQEKVKRTELAHNIVKESRGLRDAFDRAREAALNLEGGEMDLGEQEELIALLQNYKKDQRWALNS